MTKRRLKKKWGINEERAWQSKQTVKRSYRDEVIKRIEPLKSNFDIHQYGALSYEPVRYPLFMVKTRPWLGSKPTVLITGGVHGYETSGVHGAIRFIETQALRYEEHFNIAVAPCVSPWGYETINRWNPNAVDPNRSFFPNSPSEESVALMEAIALLQSGKIPGCSGGKHNILCHIDLHETTDTDNTVFRPALAARDGVEQEIWSIPDGFYLVGDIDNPSSQFQRAIIESVEKVSHIAVADQNGKIIGESISQEGVINYSTQKLGLCTGFTKCEYNTTTEVYPDSPKVSKEECILAQVAAVSGALNYLIKV